MHRIYFRMSFRYLWKHKMFTGINLIGLTTGMCVCFFALLYVQFETSYDDYHEKSKRIYRLLTDVETSTGINYESTPAPMAPAMQEERFGKLFTCLSIIAITLSCLGLFGLATLAAFQRTKEIGIRRVLGASVSSVVTLLSIDFIRLVLISIVIATPIAWYAVNHWLQGFAYRIDLQWWMFGLAGLTAIVVAIFTVATQSVRAAIANPAVALQHE